MVRLLGSWAERAACAATDAPAAEEFFPETQINGAIEAADWPVDALRTCAGCPVTRECLAYAMANKVEGVWGGTTDVDRKQILAARKRAAA